MSSQPVRISEVQTPALVIDGAIARQNIATMAAAIPGTRLRPHMKATKCTSLAREQVRAGHSTFTCATPREVVGMVKAGIGDDLLLANESVDAVRLQEMAALQDSALITVAIDSEETLQAAHAAGIQHVLIDVNVGLPRCGIAPELAGSLADKARSLGKTVRGVMGYEGHIVFDRSKPDGTPRKLLDSTRLRSLGWEPVIDLREGLQRTAEDFLAAHAAHPMMHVFSDARDGRRTRDIPRLRL